MSPEQDGLTEFFGAFSIDKQSPVPAYFQLQEWLSSEIASGRLPAGSALPAEREFAEHLGLSRMTVRQALGRLQDSGSIVRERGAGTFVAPAKLVGDMASLRGISSELADQGKTSYTRLLSADQLVAPAVVAQGFGIGQGAKAIRVQRVRSIDHGPLSLETAWLNPELCEPVLAMDLEDVSLMDVLTGPCGLVLAQGHERISVIAVSLFEASELEAEEGAPAFLVDRTTWDSEGRAVEIVMSVIRGDRFSFEAVLAPAAGSPQVTRTPSLSTDPS